MLDSAIVYHPNSTSLLAVLARSLPGKWWKDLFSWWLFMGEKLIPMMFNLEWINTCKNKHAPDEYQPNACHGLSTRGLLPQNVITCAISLGRGKKNPLAMAVMGKSTRHGCFQSINGGSHHWFTDDFPMNQSIICRSMALYQVNHLSMVFFRSESLLFRYFDEGFHNVHPYGGQFPLKAKVTPKKIWTKKTNPTSSGYCYPFI